MREAALLRWVKIIADYFDAGFSRQLAWRIIVYQASDDIHYY